MNLQGKLTIAGVRERFDALVEQDQRDIADHWARVRVIARAIPDDVDLSDDADVIRALYAARWSYPDFGSCLDAVIAQARQNRETGSK